MPDGRGPPLSFDGAPVDLRRTDRKKTISVSLRDGTVVVRAPRRVPESEIRDLLDRKAGWIRRKLREQAARPRIEPRRYVDGESFALLGAPLSLRVSEGVEAPARAGGGMLEVGVRSGLDPERRARNVRAALLLWYKAEAGQHLAARTDHWAAPLDVRPERIALKAYKSMWGQCSSTGIVTYNWKIVMAPAEVVDYVVVHELAHLHHLDHSPRFWDRVARVMPDYRIHRAWLKTHGDTLQI